MQRDEKKKTFGGGLGLDCVRNEETRGKGAKDRKSEPGKTLGTRRGGNKVYPSLFVVFKKKKVAKQDTKELR